MNNYCVHLCPTFGVGYGERGKATGKILHDHLPYEEAKSLWKYLYYYSGINFKQLLNQ
jgi:hypothetical protein